MKLSILITYHDEASWLAECLRSIELQLAAEDEILIHDDASRERAEDYVPAGSRARVLRSVDNIGPARARNRLLEAGRGTHVHFHDADDLFAPAWRTQVAAALENNVDAVFTDVGSFDDAGHQWQHVTGMARLCERHDLLEHALRGGLLVCAGTYDKQLLDKVGGFREDLWQSEDYDLHIRLALLQPRWHALPEDLVLIRRHAQQRSRNTREVWRDAVTALAQNGDHFPRNAYEQVALAATRAGSALYAAGAHDEAAHAFRLAQRFGGTRYERALMTRLTRLLGALPAERLAAAYRRILPAGWRSRLQGQR